MLGDGPATLAAIADGTHPIAEKLKNAKAPMLILGMGALGRPDGAAIYALARKVAEGCARDGWNGFNVLHTAASRVAALDLGFVPATQKPEAPEVVYLLGADEIDMDRLGDAFVIYQGSHGDRGAHRADVILPGAAYTEKDGTYVNTEGRAQMTSRAIFPPGEAREDWKILRALSAVLGDALPFDSLQELRAKMYQACPNLALFDLVGPADKAAIETLAARPAKPGKDRFGVAITDYFLSNPVARASAIMASLSAMHAGTDDKATGTDG
jgi:NADH-quinone oxidoreductase subunit G